MYPDTRNRVFYPSYVTVSPIQVGVIVETFFALFRQYNWTTIGIIYDTSGLPGYSEVVTTLKTYDSGFGFPVQLSAVAVQSTSQGFSPDSALLATKTFTRGLWRSPVISSLSSANRALLQ